MTSIIIIITLFILWLIVYTCISLYRINQIKESVQNPDNEFPCYSCGMHFPTKEMAEACMYSDELTKQRFNF